ncbi:hypothetical protein PYW08_009651 [Mythimna loreyi]|uniref:Uncharacterized protein n=1 Tax=Mythimna loreyi TaxID=667449 RepID=A0ACC2QAF6_9NEOP|nr:hypothetical protein PYW08_009651 [Mythimna loreyi]
MIVLVILLSGIVLAWWHLLRQPPRSPPLFPGALPLIGHAHHLFGDSKNLWLVLQKVQMNSVSQGGICRVLLGPHTVYVLTDPEDSLTVANSCFDKPYIYDFSKDYLKNGLITAKTSMWKVHRKVLNPAFNQQVLNTYVDDMNVQAQHLTSQLALEAGKGPFIARKYLVDFALSTVARTSMGLDPQDKTWISAGYNEKLEDLLGSYTERLRKVWLHPSFLFDWSSIKLKQDQLTNKLKDIAIQIINKRKSELEAKKNTMYDDSSDKFKSILDQLVLMPEKQGDFTPNVIREHLDSLSAAAYETTSLSTTAVLLILGSNQEVQDRVYNELKEVFEHDNFDVTKQDLPKLVYLEAVIRETMRLYPTTPIVARKVDKDVRLKNFTLRAGSTCALGLYGLLHHPVWGPDVEQFRPERWLETANSMKHSSCNNAYFGIGKRNCIGKVYTMMVMKTALAHILRRYRVTSDIKNVVWEYEIVLKPVQGHHISLTLRS